MCAFRYPAQWVLSLNDKTLPVVGFVWFGASVLVVSTSRLGGLTEREKREIEMQMNMTLVQVEAVVGGYAEDYRDVRDFYWFGDVEDRASHKQGRGLPTSNFDYFSPTIPEALRQFGYYYSSMVGELVVNSKSFRGV